MEKLAPPTRYDYISALKMYAAENDCTYIEAREALNDPAVRAEYELRARRERWEFNFRYDLTVCPYCDTKLPAPRRPGAEVSYFCTGGRPDACPGCGAVWPLKK